MTICPYCGCYIPEDMIDDDFVICPICENDVEVTNNV